MMVKKLTFTKSHHQIIKNNKTLMNNSVSKQYNVDLYFHHITPVLQLNYGK